MNFDYLQRVVNTIRGRDGGLNLTTIHPCTTPHTHTTHTTYTPHTQHTRHTHTTHTQHTRHTHTTHTQHTHTYTTEIQKYSFLTTVQWPQIYTKMQTTIWDME